MSEGFFDNMNGKQGMVFGVAIAIAAVSLIGFFTVLQKDDGPSVSGSSSGTGNRVAANQGAPTPSQPAAAPGPAPTGMPGHDPNATVTITNDDHIRGNPDAKISLVEFSDYECPFCARFHPTAQQIVDDYDGQVNWVYKHFPLNSIHPKAQKFAEGSECANELGGNDAFWAYTDAIFANQRVALTGLADIASQIGLDSTAFQTCLDSGRHAGKVNAQLAEAQAAGGRGTPYSIIVSGDTRIPVSGAQPLAQVKAIIDSLL